MGHVHRQRDLLLIDAFARVVWTSQEDHAWTGEVVYGSGSKIVVLDSPRMLSILFASATHHESVICNVGGNGPLLEQMTRISFIQCSTVEEHLSTDRPALMSIIFSSVILGLLNRY